MNLLAPLVCDALTVGEGRPCGATIRVVDETWMPDFEVFTARLRCDAGHDWLDQHDEGTDRKHPWLGQAPPPTGQLSLFGP